MKPLSIEEVPAFYQGYVKQVLHFNMFEAFDASINRFEETVRSIPEENGLYAYAPGKWSIKELIAHVINAERIFTYRALRFARKDRTPLAGFDENLYTPESNAHARTILQLADESSNLRLSTIDMFRSFNEEMPSRKGIANNTEMSVAVLAFVISGHMLHHLAILNDRYLKK